MPDIDDPEPFLTLLGTLSILYNRIKYKNLIYNYNQEFNLQIKMEDEYFNQTILEQFLGVLKLPSEKVTDGENISRLASLLNLSFSQLMNNFLESHHYPVSESSITMK